jgi:hypothetical protein
MLKAGRDEFPWIVTISAKNLLQHQRMPHVCLFGYNTRLQINVAGPIRRFEVMIQGSRINTTYDAQTSNTQGLYLSSYNFDEEIRYVS